MRIPYSIALIILLGFPGIVSAQTGRPAHGPTVHRAEAAVFSTVAQGVTVREIPGKSVSTRLYRLEPGAEFARNSGSSGNAVTVLAGGGEVETADAGKQPFRLCDSMLLDPDTPFRFTAGEEGAELVEVSVDPGSRGAEPQAAYPPGTVVDYRTLQFIMPGDGTVARLVPLAGGQLCFIRQRPSGVLNHASVKSERLWLIVRGSFVIGADGASPLLEPGDAVHIPPETGFTSRCGPDGCEVVAVNTPARADYDALLAERIRALGEIVDPDVRPVLVADGAVDDPPLHSTEGPSWMNGVLYFSDYGYRRGQGAFSMGGFHAVFPDGSRKLITSGIVTCGTTPLPNGNLAVCDIRDNRVAELAPDGSFVRTLAETFEGVPFGMPNDLVTDSRGGLYFTVPRLPRDGDAPPGSAVYYLRPGGGLERVTGWDEFDVPNGCLVSADNGRFYLSCSRESTVWTYDIGRDGGLSNKRPFAGVIPPENPRDKDRRRGIADGMALDTDGNVYVATCHGIDVYDRDGGYIGFLYVPVSPSNCVFGGRDLSTLFITSRDRLYSIRLRTRGYEYPIR